MNEGFDRPRFLRIYSAAIYLYLFIGYRKGAVE